MVNKIITYIRNIFKTKYEFVEEVCPYQKTIYSTEKNGNYVSGSAHTEEDKAKVLYNEIIQNGKLHRKNTLIKNYR